MHPGTYHAWHGLDGQDVVYVELCRVLEKVMSIADLTVGSSVEHSASPGKSEAGVYVEVSLTLSNVSVYSRISSFTDRSENRFNSSFSLSVV
jgi:hypothetical protein